MSEQLQDTGSDGGDDDLGLEYNPETDDSTADDPRDDDTTDMDQAELLEAMLSEDGSSADRAGDAEEAVDDKAADGPKPEPVVPKAKREERVVVQLQRSQESLVAAQARIRELESAPRVRGVQPTGDLVGDIIELVAQTKGYKADDPRVRDVLRNEVGGGILAELSGDTKDPELRRIQDRRAQLREHLKVQSEIEAMKAEAKTGLSAAKQERAEVEGRNFVSAVLAKSPVASDYPYLSAVSDDVQGDVMEALGAMSANGWVPGGPQDIEDGIAYALRTLEKDRRSTAERLQRVANGRKAADSPTSPSETRVARMEGPVEGRRGEDKARQGRRTSVTASGPGSRKPPAPRTDESPEDLLESLLKEELQERRRNAAQRSRR